MGKKKDFKKLCRWARKCKFIMEVGSGLSTIYLAKTALKYNIKMVSIDVIEKEKIKGIKGFEFFKGWSITENDIIKVGDPYFIEHPGIATDSAARNDIIRKIAHGENVKMEGEKDLIRKILDKSEIPLDFFFCDSGEYCGLAEWNIVNYPRLKSWAS